MTMGKNRGNHLWGKPQRWFPFFAGNRNPRRFRREEKRYFFFRMGIPVFAVSWTM